MIGGLRLMWKVSLFFNILSTVLNVAARDQMWSWMGFIGICVSLFGLHITADEEKLDE